MNPRRIAILTIALLALLPAAPAAAKSVPVRSARVCGLTDCVPLPAGMVAQMLGRFEGGSAGNPGMRLGPFYRLHIRPQSGQAFLFYVPVSHILVVNGQTVRVGPRRAALLAAALREVQPIPPRIVRVTVGTHRAAHPLAYTPLIYGRPVYPPASVWKHRDVLIGIDLAGETPWTYWGSAEYIPALRLLHVPERRDGGGRDRARGCDRRGAGRRPAAASLAAGPGCLAGAGGDARGPVSPRAT